MDPVSLLIGFAVGALLAGWLGEYVHREDATLARWLIEPAEPEE